MAQPAAGHKCHLLHLLHHAVCSPSCENGGTCSSGVCHCAPGYTGKYCQRASSSGSGEYKISVCPCVLACVCCVTPSGYHSLTTFLCIHVRAHRQWLGTYTVHREEWVQVSGCVFIYRVCACANGKVGHVCCCVCVCAYFACLLCCIWCLIKIIYDLLLQEGAERKTIT